MTADVRICIRTTLQCARFRAPQDRPATGTVTLILAQTSPNCANIRIPCSVPNSPQASLKLASMIFYNFQVRIPRAQKIPASFARKLWLSTLPSSKMGKMQPNQVASMTTSLLKPSTKILTNGNKIHHGSLVKVSVKPGQTTRFWRMERTGQRRR